MRYMVIEHYTDGPEPVYRRAAARGRMLPDGLRYLDSWVVDDDRLDTCFQLMETEDPSLFDVWQANWSDLGTFERFPVTDSAEAARRVAVGWAGGEGPGPGRGGEPGVPGSPEGWRRPRPEDHASVAGVVNHWWGGRDLAGLVQPLFFEHFASTSWIVEDEGALAAFLVAFDSADLADCTYVHFVGVRPDRRGSGLGRSLYTRTFADAAGRGRSRVRCVTGLVNRSSVAFHRAMGFAIVRGDAARDGVSYHRDHGGPGVDHVVFERVLER